MYVLLLSSNILEDALVCSYECTLRGIPTTCLPPSDDQTRPLCVMKAAFM